MLEKKAETGSVPLCRIGDREGERDEVSCVLVKTEESSLMLTGMKYGEFGDLLRSEGYEPDIWAGGLVMCGPGAFQKNSIWHSSFNYCTTTTPLH